MSIRSVAKTSLVVTTVALSTVQLHTVLIKQARGEAPLTSPLTSPVITLPEDNTPLTAPVQTPTNGNNSGNNNNSNNSGGSNNNGGNNNNGPRECNATKPTTAPILLRATQVAKDKVTLFWGKSNGPATGYVIVFGQKPGQELYATGTFGNGETTSFTVNSLQPGNLYYFRVKAINDCKPSDTSNELAIRLGSKYFMTSVIKKQPNTIHNGATYSLSPATKFAPKKATKPVTIPFKKVEEPLLLSDLKTFFGKLFGK